MTASSDAGKIDLGCDVEQYLGLLSSFDIRSAASSHVALARDERLATIEGIAGAYVGEPRILTKRAPRGNHLILAGGSFVLPMRIQSIDGDNTIDGNTGSSITSAAPEILFDMELRASVPCSALEITEWRVPKKAKMYGLSVKLVRPDDASSDDEADGNDEAKETFLGFLNRNTCTQLRSNLSVLSGEPRKCLERCDSERPLGPKQHDVSRSDDDYGP